MADQFVAEIRLFPFDFAPPGWALCDGELLPISQNTALFALLGTSYGGDGRSTFALPNLNGRFPLHAGQGPGLREYYLGESGGEESVTLLESQMPSHLHRMHASPAPGSENEPGDRMLAVPRSGRFPVRNYAEPGTATSRLNLAALESAGATAPHNNMPPYLTLNFCIALQGVFPPRD